MKAYTFLLLAFLCLTASSIEVLKGPHECHHDKLDIKLETVDTGDDQLDGDRTLITYESIRIILDFSTMSSTSSATKTYIQTQVLPPVQNLLTSALKVQRLTAPLTAGGATTMCSGAVTTPSVYNSGGVNADLVIFVVDTTDSTSGYIAQAGACSISTANYRPVFGLLRYNLYYISSTTNDATIESHIYTTLHEITHVLGFSSGLYGYYINPTTNTVLTGHVTSKTVNGASVTVLNLAPLTTRIRSHFGCSTIEGAYLENEGGSGSAGSHFERRIFYNEVNNDAYADNCPIRYEYSNMDCEDTTRAKLLTAYESNGYGSKGFTGTLYPGGTLASPYGYCFNYNCVASGSSYTLQVLFGSSYTATCTAAGQINAPTGTGIGGKLYCPDPTKFCTQVLSEGYCKGSCFGRGTCTNRQCVCQDGWTFHDCIKKTYVDNCARCAGNGYKTSCYGDECVCNPSNSSCTAYALGLPVPPVNFDDNTEPKTPEQGPTGFYPGDFSFFSLVAVLLAAAVVVAGLRAGAKSVPAPIKKQHVKPQAVPTTEVDPEVQIKN